VTPVAVASAMWALLIVCLIAAVAISLSFSTSERRGGLVRFSVALIWTLIGALFIATVAVTAQAALT